MRIKDKLLHFTFNGIHSSDFDVFYENRGEDISLPLAHIHKHELASPLYQGNSYWLGSNKEAREFNFNIAVGDKTFYESEEIFDWLDPSKPGLLSIDANPNYQYSVIISSIGTPTILPKQLPNGLIKNILLFPITFTTIGKHYAETIERFQFSILERDSNKTFYEPEDLLPIAYYDNSYHFINWTKENQYFKLKTGISCTLMVKDGQENREIYNYNISTFDGDVDPNEIEIEVDTELGAIREGNRMIEAKYPKETETINQGPLAIKPGTVFRGPMKLNIKELTPGIRTFAIAIDKLGEEVKKGIKYLLVIEPNYSAKTPLIELSEENIKGQVYRGLYSGDRSESETQIDFPEYFEGIVKTNAVSNEDELVFSLASSSLESGAYKVRIAEQVEVEVLGDWNHLLEFSYRKKV